MDQEKMKSISIKLAEIKRLLDLLPDNLGRVKSDLYLDYKLLEDKFRDKFTRIRFLKNGDV